MSTALYRRYRPETFTEVIGQDHVTEPLKAALKANRVTHAYLFSGPRGCGKTTSARILARCLNCIEGPTDTPCGKCDSCIELATGGPGSLDVVEIDAASHNGVDDARELRERAAFAPARDRYKVFILDEAHMVTPQGFNALLKLVEEPPEHVKFVFATTEPERVIGTIRSRTHHYPFRLVPADVLIPYLTSLCVAENIEVAEGVLSLVVRAGGGSVRDSLSVLDQLMAGAENGVITYERAIALLGYTDGSILDNIILNLNDGNGNAAFEALEQLVDSGHDPRRFVEDFLQRLRDLLIISIAPDGARALLQGIPVEQAQRMYHQAGQWGAAKLSKAADLTDEALRSMVGATSPKLQVELLLGRILVETQQLGRNIAEFSEGGAGNPVSQTMTEANEPSQHEYNHSAELARTTGLSGAALAKEEARRIREQQAAKVQAVSANLAGRAEAPAETLVSVGVEPLEAPLNSEELTAYAPEKAVNTSISRPSSAHTAATETVETVKLADQWQDFTRLFLSKHPLWNKFVELLKPAEETENTVTLELPTAEHIAKALAKKADSLCADVISELLKRTVTVKFREPAVFETISAETVSLQDIAVSAEIVDQQNSPLAVVADLPAPMYVVPEPVQPIQPIYQLESNYQPAPEYQPMPEYQPEPVYEFKPQYAPEPQPVFTPQYQPEPEYNVEPVGYDTPPVESYTALQQEANPPVPASSVGYQPWDDETGGASLSDADVAETREVGVPVVQKVFNAAIIEEIKDGE